MNKSLTNRMTRTLVLSVMMILGASMTGGCFKKAGGDAATGMIETLKAEFNSQLESAKKDAIGYAEGIKAQAFAYAEKKADQAVQSRIPEVEASVSMAFDKIEAQATSHGIPVEHIQWIKGVILFWLGNFLRNRKYRELSIWKQIFSFGLPAPTGTGSGKIAEPPIDAQPVGRKLPE